MCFLHDVCVYDASLLRQAIDHIPPSDLEELVTQVRPEMPRLSASFQLSSHRCLRAPSSVFIAILRVNGKDNLTPFSGSGLQAGSPTKGCYFLRGTHSRNTSPSTALLDPSSNSEYSGLHPRRKTDAAALCTTMHLCQSKLDSSPSAAWCWRP